MTKAIRIGIIGDFEPAYHSDFATNAALYDAATKLNVPLMVRWIAKPTLDSTEAPENAQPLGRPDRLPRESL